MKYVVLDLETTGLDVKTARIVELSLKMYQGNKIISSLNQRLRIPDNIHMSADSEAVTGITDESAHNPVLPTFDDIKNDVMAMLSQSDLIVGFGIERFDYPILQNEFERIGINFELGSKNDIYDCLRVYHQDAPRKLENAYQHYLPNKNAPDPEQLHGADYDVQLTAEVFQAQTSGRGLNALLEYKKANLDLVGKLKYDSEGDIIITFGKYKNKKVQDVPTDYLRWVFSNIKLDSSSIKKVEMEVGI